jgi:hypothetical protein
MRLQGGSKKHESRERAQDRRSRSDRRKILELVKQVREDEARRHADALALVESALPRYEDVPL